MSHIPYDYMKILTAALSVSISGGDQLHGARVACEPFVFEALKNRYGRALDMHFDLCTIPKVSDKALVIVERRCHANLEFCIKNAVFFNPGFALHIFCSKANFEFVKLICGKHLHSIHIHVTMDGLGSPAEGREEYNKMLRTRKFWEELSEEHLILFETDCYFLRPVPPTIFAYDYVAAKWAWMPDAAGGGGLSYRKRSVMLDICDRYAREETVMQDCFASEGIAALGYKYPSVEENAKFFTESCMSEGAAGTHQWWTFLIRRDIQQMLQIIHNYLKLAMD